MKWLVYFLLLANAVFFARQYYQLADAPPPPQQAVRPYDHVNRLLLFSETDVSKLRPRQPELEPAVAAAVEAPSESSLPTAESGVVPVLSCYSIGPLEDEAQIAAVRTWLVAMGGDPVLRVEQRSEPDRFWVYFPPLASREEAMQKVERMRSQGIDDVIAVFSGDMENAISLGVFSQRRSLERRLQELRGLGYDPMVLNRFSSERASWFDVSFEEGEGLLQKEFAARFPQVQLSEAGCVSGEIARDGAGS
jgi:hypothetical protein